ncbi:hypothetical protein JHK86_001294 [Glycine max]|nr:hypothetical protein JHK86_001294 [Glycine max]
MASSEKRKRTICKRAVVKVDPQGKCGGVLIYDLQVIILNATQCMEKVMRGFFGNFAIPIKEEVWVYELV